MQHYYSISKLNYSTTTTHSTRSHYHQQSTECIAAMRQLAATLLQVGAEKFRAHSLRNRSGLPQILGLVPQRNLLSLRKQWKHRRKSFKSQFSQIALDDRCRSRSLGWHHDLKSATRTNSRNSYMRGVWTKANAMGYENNVERTNTHSHNGKRLPIHRQPLRSKRPAHLMLKR